MRGGRCFKMALASGVIGATLAACGGATGPRTTLERYAEALRENDYDAAYSLMSAEFRGQYSLKEFKAMLASNREEAQETARRLDSRAGQLVVEAQFEYGLGEQLRMVKEGDSWRIANNPLDFYGQATPEETVRSFVRAYSLKRWDVMLRFVPKTYRERMNVDMVKKQFDGPRKEEMAEMIKKLEVNLGSPTSTVQKGNQARLRYGQEYEVELVREQGLWKIKRL